MAAMSGENVVEPILDAVEDVDYEQLRAANIKRNQEIMRALGLDSNDFKLHAEEKKQGKDSGKKRNRSKELPEGSAKSPKLGAAKTESPATRRSSRVRGIAVDNSNELPQDFEEGEEGEESQSRVSMAASEDHESAERNYLRWAGRQSKATVVGTASYKHTLHRVMSMSEKALAQRIRTIERAKGQHAVVKMKLFAQVLCLEGYDDLANDATEAYKRLSDLLGEPEPEPEEGEEEDEKENNPDQQKEGGGDHGAGKVSGDA